MPKAGSGLSLDGLGMPLWLVIELTYKCPLKCPWCSNPVDFDRYRNELSTEEWKKVLQAGRRLGSLQLGFTGGEPMLRHDLEELVEEAERLGYYTNLITSGVGLNPDRLRALKKAGLKQIQLSIQACDQELNEKLVGLDVFAHKIAIARTIKAEGFPMVLNVPVSRYNIDQTEALIELAADLGVEYLEFANLQYYNWALLNRAELLPTREQLARSEAQVNAARKRLGKRLTIFFVVLIIALNGASYGEVGAALANPFVSLLTIAALLSVSWHMKLGMQVVIEDYVHGEGAKLVLLMLNSFFTGAVALISVLGLLKLAFGA